MAPPVAAVEGQGSVKVKKSQVEKAVRALVQLNAKRSAKANPLFDVSAETMNLLFTLSSIPDKKKVKPQLIELPHPLFDSKSEICFLSKDPQKQYKELLMQKHHVPGITKVIGMEQLKRDYKTAEAKRALADAFDLFLCDSRIVELMPKVLGSIFYEKKLKRPIPVKLKPQEPAENLQSAINSTALRLPAGPCLGIRFGRCSMDEKELVANAATVISYVSKYLQTHPVQTISVQATDSPALPIWRRESPPGDPLNPKKLRSDAASSSASDTAVSGASDTDSVLGSDFPSDAGETMSELDSEAGDVDQSGPDKHRLPLVQGLRAKKRKLHDMSSQAKKAIS